MASKSKRGRSRSKRSRTSKPILDYATSLQRAQRALEQNQADSAQHFAEKALEFINPERNPQAAAAAHKFLAEAHFRLAADTFWAQDQEKHLNTALAFFPNEPRFHFHRAIALLRQAKLADVATALEKAAGHPGVDFVGALLRIATDQAWDEKGLIAEEANTLRLVQAVHQDKPAQDLHELAQQPLLASNEIWQALLDLRADTSSVAPAHLQKLAEPLSNGLAQGILHYYAGVAALSGGQKTEAQELWRASIASGWRTPWQTENSEYLAREATIELAQDEKWAEIVALTEQLPGSVNDRILSETIGTAYFVLGFQAAEAANWQTAADYLRRAGTFTGGRALSQNLAICEEALENWNAAGDAWREMARRRPRSTDHPDYLTDAQVAALWAHAAECYDRSEYVNEEVVNCLRTAVKYAEDDIELRTKLVDALMQDEREDAAENELARILEIDENHIPTLLRLGHIAADKWDGNPVPHFRKVLAIEPDNREARDSLAAYYLEQAGSIRAPMSIFGRLMNRGEGKSIKVLKEALQDLPGHPQILIALGVEYREAGKKKEASAALQEAYRVEPSQVETVGIVMHELLHLKESAVVEQMVAEVRQIPTLLMGFWVSQGSQALACELDDSWAVRFFDEALLLADKKRGNDSRPAALVQIVDATFENRADDLTKRYLDRVRAEMPESGILEYVEAQVYFREEKDVKKAQRMLRKAKRMAQKMDDPSLVKEMEDLEQLFAGPRNPFLDILRNFGGDDDFDFF